MAKLLSKLTERCTADGHYAEDGSVVITIEVSEQDLKFYPQYYGLTSERRERQ